MSEEVGNVNKNSIDNDDNDNVDKDMQSVTVLQTWAR